jgi:hypothetical protein
MPVLGITSLGEDVISGAGFFKKEPGEKNQEKRIKRKEPGEKNQETRIKRQDRFEKNLFLRV